MRDNKSKAGPSKAWPLQALPMDVGPGYVSPAGAPGSRTGTHKMKNRKETCPHSAWASPSQNRDWTAELPVSLVKLPLEPVGATLLTLHDRRQMA